MAAKVSLVHDVDDTRENEYGAYYSKKNPLTLEELGVARNTLVFLLGDNGSDAPLGGPHEVACAAPLRGKKDHYDGGLPLRMPFADHKMKRRIQFTYSRSVLSAMWRTRMS